MSEETTNQLPGHASLEAVLAEYLRAVEAGHTPSEADLLARHPDLATELKSFFENRRQMEDVARPLRAAGESVRPAGRHQRIRYLGDYELLEEIASGGMGIVYKARQISLNRIVAVKMILRGTFATEEDVKRFRAEAEAAASLQHPGIVAIHEVGLHEGQHYFSMDFVEGRSLAHLPAEHPLTARQAAEYVRDAAEALHYAHQQGTLHRDLKPSNILIDRRDRVRITDFGLAKRIEDKSDLTLTGQILGTPSYMPPEQALGKHSLIGTASDVYSLGAVLYELLTGRPPFRGESPVETLKLVETLDPVTPRLLSPATPRDLETICLKCLEKEPHKRYGTAQLLADDLKRFLRHEPIFARPIGRLARGLRWSRRHPVVAVLATISLMLLLLATITSTAGYHSTRRAWQSEIERRHAEDKLRIGKLVELLNDQHPDLVQAEKILTEAIDNRPTDPEFYLHRARVRFEQGNVRSAYQDALRSTVLKPVDNTSAKMLLAEAALLMGDRASALAQCRELEQEAPDSAEALAARALAEPLVPGSLDRLSQAIVLEPRDPRYLARRGNIAWHLTQYRTSKSFFDQTIADLDRALQLRPFDSWSRRRLCACLVQFHFLADQGTRPLERAKNLLDASLATTPDDLDYLAILARWHLVEDKPSDAIAVCARGSRIDPSRAQFSYLRGQALYRLKQYEEAEKALHNASQLLTRSESPQVIAISNVEIDAARAQVAVMRRDLATAERLVSPFTTVAPDQEWTYENWQAITSAWRELGKQQPAAKGAGPDTQPAGLRFSRQLCQEWQKRAPACPGPHQALGHLEPERGAPSRIEHFSAALRLAPSYRWPLYHRGKLYALAGARVEAQRDLEEFLNYFPDQPLGTQELAKVLVQGDKPEDWMRARDLAERFVKVDTDGKGWWQLLAQSELLLQRPQEALAAIDVAVMADPKSETLLMWRGEILIALNRWPEAMANYQNLLDAHRPSVDRLEAIALSLVLRPGGNPECYEFALRLTEQAEVMFEEEKAASKRQNFAKFGSRARGIAYYRLGREKDALALAQLEPFVRVMALWRTGDRDQAWRLYQDQARAVAERLLMLNPRKAVEARFRLEAAEVIGAQFGDTTIREDVALRGAGPGDYPQWGGWGGRNNVSTAARGPGDWEIGSFDRETGAWNGEKARNIKWVAPLGSLTYGNPAVAGGRIFVGTNNGHGYLGRYPSDVDISCLIALDEADGSFLWQHCSEKLPTGRVHDRPMMGICSAPLVENDRLWFVTNRGEVRCLDVAGLYDGKDDGRPESEEPAKLFEIMPITADDNSVLDIVAELNESRINARLREHFAKAKVELPADVAVAELPDASTQEQRWRLMASQAGALREFILAYRGPKLSAYRITTPNDKHEADVIWVFDMMKELGISQHNMCTCAPTAWGDLLFINTSNGVDESHRAIPAPEAPSFIALDKHQGKVVWTDNSPGANIHHGQWSAPAVGVFNGVPQVIFGAGDGWVYSFHAEEWSDAKPQLLWKFDTNPKDAILELGGRGTRDEPIAVPVVYDGYVYVTNGQDPEHGEGIGHLWCIDPTRRGDVSPQLAVHINDRNTVLPHRRNQAIDRQKGEMAIDNPNSALIWHYSRLDANGDLKYDFEEEFHRSISSVVAKNDVLVAVDFSGLCHCLNAKTGRRYWTCDMLAAAWGTPLIVGDRVYVPDEDGDISILHLHPDPERSITPTDHFPVREIMMGNSIYTTPIFANGVLYIANKDHLFAVEEAELSANSDTNWKDNQFSK